MNVAQRQERPLAERERVLWMAIRRAFLMAAAAIGDYLGLEK